MQILYRAQTVSRELQNGEVNRVEITWYGANCVGLREQGVTVLYDPFVKAVSTASPTLLDLVDDKPGADPLMNPGFDVDIAVSSQYMEPDSLTALPGTPAVISVPGEFEFRGVFIHALRLELPDNGGDAALPWHLAHHMDFGSFGITHLGMPGAMFRTADRRLVENLITAKTDILVLPLGQGEGLEMEWAIRMCRQLEPRYCIPINYGVGDMERIISSLQTLGPLQTEVQKRFRSTRKDAGEEGTATFLLSVSDISRP